MQKTINSSEKTTTIPGTRAQHLAAHIEHLEARRNANATIKELLIVKHSSIMTSVPDVVTVFKIFLTLPVTVASAEIYFSKLELIKNYMRSTMSQDMLSGLSIENERARNLDLSEIVKQFAEKNARRRIRFS